MMKKTSGILLINNSKTWTWIRSTRKQKTTEMKRSFTSQLVYTAKNSKA